jgi:hypothetical protein
MSLARDQVIAEIDTAFSGVTLGAGVGLHEGQGLDDYRPRNELVEVRAKDEKTDWRRIPRAELSRCYSSLSFFDAEGMRFHLPAFMIADLLDELMNFDVVFTLTHGLADGVSDAHAMAKFELLSEAQARAVVHYLSLKAEDEWDREVIQQALRNYWSGRAGLAPVS